MLRMTLMSAAHQHILCAGVWMLFYCVLGKIIYNHSINELLTSIVDHSREVQYSLCTCLKYTITTLLFFVLLFVASGSFVVA